MHGSCSLFGSGLLFVCCVFFCKQKTAYEMRMSDWSSDVCSSDLAARGAGARARRRSQQRGGDRHRSAPDHRGRRLVVGRGRAGGLRPHRGQHRAPGLRGRRAPQTEPAMSIRFGVSPIAWSNDDMPELGGDTPLDDILREIAELGFEGVELGGRFPRESAALAALLGGHGLDLIGGWYSGSLLERDADEEIRALQPHLSLLKALGASAFVFAETSNAVHGERGTPLDATPRLQDGQDRKSTRLNSSH